VKILIIGYGNTLRGDDGIGVLAVEALEEAGMPPNVDMITCQQLTPELAEELAFCDRVAFIDACMPDGNPPGTIKRKTLEPTSVDPGNITHGFDAGGLLALTQMLYGKQPVAVIFTITGGSFDLSESLSEPVENALLNLMIQVDEWIQEGSG